MLVAPNHSVLDTRVFLIGPFGVGQLPGSFARAFERLGFDAIRRHAAGLWGSRWHRAAKRFGGRHQIHTRPAFGTACAGIYAGAAVALNVVDDLNMPGHNMRTFEIPASGGLMLSTYTDDQAALFPQNEAAPYYRDPAELDDQLDRVLGDKAWAARLRANAAASAVTHDYRERAKVIAADLGA